MSPWPFACLITACIFALIAYYFTILKGNAAVFLPGFLLFSEERRKQYDTDRMIREKRDVIAGWATTLLIGSLLGFLVHPFCSAFLFVMWLLIFFRDVNLEKEEAYEKYRTGKEKTK
ncbi:MAG: DUF3784 domain-containing protein [Bulleidia sp.]